MSNEYMEKYLGQLKGKKIKNLVRDPDDDVWGLRFTDGTMAFILCDPEGNGPGFLDIVTKDQMEKSEV